MNILVWIADILVCTKTELQNHNLTVCKSFKQFVLCSEISLIVWFEQLRINGYTLRQGIVHYNFQKILNNLVSNSLRLRLLNQPNCCQFIGGWHKVINTSLIQHIFLLKYMPYQCFEVTIPLYPNSRHNHGLNDRLVLFLSLSNNAMHTILSK